MKKPKMEECIICADFETTTKENFGDKSFVYLANWMYLEDTDEHNHLSYNIEEFFESLYASGEKNVKCYFHNGGKFDFRFILWFLLDTLQYEHVPDIRDLKQGRLWTLEDTVKIYQLKFFYKDMYVNMCDSYLLLQANIRNLGKTYGLDKLNFNYDLAYKPNKAYTQEEIDYVHNDVAIMRRALSAYSDYWNGLEKLTVSANTYEQVHNIMKGGSFDLSIQDFLYLQNWYRGGFTSFKPNTFNQWIKGDWKVYDINSSYPFQMAYSDMPYGQPLKEKPNCPHYTFLKVLIEHAKLKKDNWIPCIPKQKGIPSDNMTAYMKECFYQTLYVTDFEFEVIKKFYDIEYQIEEEIYFRKCNFLQKYILELYEKKKLYKQQKDEANLGLTKIALNSIYGKFAQAPMRNQVYYLTKEQLKRKWWKNVRITATRHTDSWIGNKQAFICMDMNEEELDIKYIPIAIITTSLARTYLLNAIYENIENVYYCDTDSMFVNGNAKGIEEDEYKLGAWKVEAIGTEFNYLQAKFYRLYNGDEISKSANAGMDKRIAKLIPKDKFKLGMTIKNGKLKSVKVKGGIMLIETDLTIGEVDLDGLGWYSMSIPGEDNGD